MNWFELVPIVFVAMAERYLDRNARSSCWKELLTGTREHKLKLSAFGWFAVPLDQLTGPLRWISSIISC